jgi:hypothetical protein
LLLATRSAGLDAACETEITNFEITVRIQQEVGWLEVAVNNIRAVDGLEGSQGLIDEIL